MNSSLPGITSLVLIVGLTCVRGSAQDNVLIVIADDLGTDYVSVYGEGAAPAPTPNLDALASRGVLFRNAWACPTCSPTRASFLTGRYGYRTGVGAPGATLGTQETTFAERLRDTGSAHARGYFGKWHLGSGAGSHPNDQGWTDFAGILGGGVGDYYRWGRDVNGVTRRSTTYTTTQIVDDALAWIGAQTGPWVCVVAFNAPHTPFHAPPANLHTQTLPAVDPNLDPVPFYTAAVEAMDSEIGRLTATLGSELARTNVMFFGDNGTPRQVSIAPFTRAHAKGTPYEGGVGVPFIFAGPAVAAPGREVSGLVGAVDVFASIGDLVGRDLAPPFLKQDSVSFVPYLADPAAVHQRQIIYSESFGNAGADLDGEALARNDRYKLIRRYDLSGLASEELYDLVSDPFETSSLLPNPGGAAASAYVELGAAIDAVRDRNGRFETLGTASCVGSAGVPLIAGSGTPAIGSSYDVLLSDAPSGTAVILALGLSESWDATLGVALPFDSASVGGGLGCVLTTSLDLQLPFVTDAAGRATMNLSVPMLPELIGGSILHSWIVIDPLAPANGLGLTVTSGMRAIFGD